MRKGLLMAAVAGVIASAFAASPSFAANEVKVGYILPLTGGGAEYGQRQLRGAELALARINAEQDENGFVVTLVTADTKCVPLEAANAAERLVEREEVDIMIGGSCSPEAIAALQVTQRLEVPHIVPTAAASSITEQGNPYVFRIIPHTQQMGRHLADVLVDRLDAKRIATVYLNDDFGIDLNNAIVAQAKERGVEVVAQEAVERTTVDFFSIVSKLKPLKPDYVAAPLFNKAAAQLARAIQEQGMEAPLADTVMFTDDYYELAGSASHGSVQNTFFHYTTKSQRGQKFVEEFKAKYDGAIPGNFEAEGYDAIGVVVDALKRSGAGKDGFSAAAFLKTIAATDGYEGVMGPIKFDEKGQVEATDAKFVVIRNVDGKLQPLE